MTLSTDRQKGLVRKQYTRHQNRFMHWANRILLLRKNPAEADIPLGGVREMLSKQKEMTLRKRLIRSGQFASTARWDWKNNPDGKQ